jgi:hypothetical protein
MKNNLSQKLACLTDGVQSSTVTERAGIFAIVDAAGFEYSFLFNALTGFLPILGLVAWLLGQLVGRLVRTT